MGVELFVWVISMKSCWVRRNLAGLIDLKDRCNYLEMLWMIVD